MSVIVALVAAYGVYLVWTALAFGWSGLGVADRRVAQRRHDRPSVQELLVQAGIPEVRLTEFAAASSVVGAVSGGFGYVVFGALVPAIMIGGAACLVPLASARSQRDRRIAGAREAWPRMIEELRLQAVSLGRSIPQALFEVGNRGPEELRPAFASARREWLMSTDFDRTLQVLKAQLADPTADAVCETLLLAHEVGGQEVDARLRALVDDRVMDLNGRKDAQSRQAGARFARMFVLLVPLGMALVGLTIGEGRLAYQTAVGQIAIIVALSMILACWIWAGRIMRLPSEVRVFGDVAIEATGGAS